MFGFEAACFRGSFCCLYICLGVSLVRPLVPSVQQATLEGTGGGRLGRIPNPKRPTTTPDKVTVRFINLDVKWSKAKDLYNPPA